MKSFINNYFRYLSKDCNIDIKKNSSWVFYFSDKNKQNLLQFINNLDSNLYSRYEIYYEDGRYYLYIEEINIHTKESLYRRYKKLLYVAKKFRIEHFYGFDAENITLI